ncbi:hypothetical protein [Actinomadura sp. 3N407]
MSTSAQPSVEHVNWSAHQARAAFMERLCFAGPLTPTRSGSR